MLKVLLFYVVSNGHDCFMGYMVHLLYFLKKEEYLEDSEAREGEDWWELLLFIKNNIKRL